MKNKKLLIGSLALAVVGLGSLAFITKPSYKTIDNTNLDERMAVYINEGDGNYEASTTIPTSGYILNEGKSSCNNGATPTWNSSSKNLKIKNLSSNNTSCYLYFDKQESKTPEQVLGSLGVSSKGSLDTTITSVETGEGGVYSATDATYGGTTYYYRGAVTNNYVVFAEKCWRIVRINGNGSIRLIFDSSTTTCKENGQGENAVASQAYNSVKTDNAYVGYMKGINNTGNSSSYDQAHTNSYDSDIKAYLDGWYDTNIGNNEEYYKWIDEEAGFCNDRGLSSGYESAGVGTTTTYYAAYDRIAKTATNATPTFGCSTRSEDLFTPSTSSIGNKLLGKDTSRPIGLITADEVVFAGALYGSEAGKNQSYYLYNKKHYWTMSPDSFLSGYVSAGVFYVQQSGYLTNTNVDNTTPGGVRPVINLKSTTTFSSGNGEKDTPYVVEGSEI